MFDVVFISYDELNADENWARLLDQVPYAIRVHEVKGIANAHIEAAKQVTTTHFYCVDADNIVDDNFDFDHRSIVDFNRKDTRVHVWGCRNPVNGLDYGYGGIKLFPTNHVELIKEYSVDFCTSVAAASGGFRYHDRIASTTHFNTSKYNAWKSGYRECTKLAGSVIVNNDDCETRERLWTWMTHVEKDSKYGKYVIAGARMGAIEGCTHPNRITIINDFENCRSIFDESVKGRDIEDIIIECGDIIDDMHIADMPIYNNLQIGNV